MTNDEIRAKILSAIADVAPEADLGRLPYDADIRDELDIDSIDFTNYVITLHKAFGIDFPEADYRHLCTVGGASDYISGVIHRGAPATPSAAPHGAT